MKQEIDGLVKQNTCKVVCRIEVQDDAHEGERPFVLIKKDEGSFKVQWKTSLVLRVHKGVLKT